MPRTAALPRRTMLLASAVVVMTACSSAGSTLTTAPPTPRPSHTVGSTWTPTPALQPRTTRPPAPPSQPPTAAAPIPGAYPGAGGAIPPDATPAAEQIDGAFIVRSPSGNSGCDLIPGNAGCGVLTLHESAALGLDESESPLWWVSLDSDPSAAPVVVAHPAPPLFAQHDAQLLAYGEVAYLGPYVCASADTGLTCWNADTGRGALLQRDTIQGF